MLAYKVFGAGLPGLAVTAICQDIVTGITAAGTSQSDATSLTASVNVVSTVAAGTGVVLSSEARGGDSQLVYNGGSNPMIVYPPSGAQINSLALNGGVIIPIRTSCEFHCFSTTQWTANLSA